MDASQATFITVGGQGAMLASIQSKRIAAGLLNPPHNFLAYREGLKNLAFAGNFVRIPSTGIVTMRETLERSPDQVRRLLRALTRARAFAKDNRAATVAILKRFVQLNDEELVGKIYDYHKRAETADGKVESALAADSTYEKASVGLTRVTARIEGTDTVSVDLAGLSKQFQDEIEGWRTAVATPDSTVSDSAVTDSVTTDSAKAMVRDSVSQ
jgi:ABC-type nitrate/sulfonate/bicarbonate transport system substrate-binding protein